MIVPRLRCSRARSCASAPPPGRLFWITGLLLVAACATRAVPDHFPEAAAVSPAASAPKPAEVTRALREEPGAGEATDADAAPPHAHQHGGHHHAH